MTLLAALLVLALAPAAAAELSEPNESGSTATGPLLFGQTYEAAIEAQMDKDFFSFYVTAPGQVPVTITLRNLGDGSEVLGLSAAIVDSAGSTVSPFAYSLTGGKEAAVSTTLEPGRYLLEVKPSLETSWGMSYLVTTGGGPGAFGSYEEITARCASGKAAIESARTRLQRARSKLQRASARFRQSRYGSPNERKATRRHYRQAKALVDQRGRKLNSSGGLTQPWCSIPQ